MDDFSHIPVPSIEDDDFEQFIEEDEDLGDWKGLKAKAEILAQNLSKIQPLESKEIPEILQRWQSMHKQRKQRATIKIYEEYFIEWRSLLQQNFHLLFYGLGSKKLLIERFVLDQLSPFHPVVIINGYFPYITLKEFVKLIKHRILRIKYDEEATLQSENDYLEWFRHEFTKSGRCLYIVVHNLDELVRHNPSIWTMLTEHLAVPPAQVRMIISVDHHYSATLIPVGMPVLWIQSSTGIPYDQEIAFREVSKKTNSRTQMNPQQAESNAIRTLQSLSDRAVLVFCIFANLVINDLDRGIDFSVIFEKTNLCGSIDLKSFETHINHFQGYHMIIKDTKTQRLKTNLTKESLEKILEMHTKVWEPYAADLMVRYFLNSLAIMTKHLVGILN